LVLFVGDGDEGLILGSCQGVWIDFNLGRKGKNLPALEEVSSKGRNIACRQRRRRRKKKKKKEEEEEATREILDINF
jgi:hypothetical protein